MEHNIDDDLTNNYNEEPKNMVHHQDMEFSILGLKVKWRGTIFFSVLALSVLLNFFLVFKVMDTQKEISTMQEKMYERVIEEIKPKIEKIDQNIKQTNDLLDEKIKNNEANDEDI